MSVVLVTGAGAGFGYQASLVFARQGHTVFAAVEADRSGAGDRSEQLRALAQDERLDLHVVALDQRDTKAVEIAVDEVLATGGRIDILVNAGGSELRGPVEETSDDELFAVFDTNVFGLVRMLRAVLPVMRRQRAGVIVTVSGVAGLVARPFGGAYSAAKHGVEAISEALHLEAKPFGIRVAIIEPGQFATESAVHPDVVAAHDATSPYQDAAAEFDAAVRRLVPDGRPADPDAVADLIVQVAEDDAAPLRHLAGADAELIVSVRRAVEFEEYEQTMRAALDWRS